MLRRRQLLMILMGLGCLLPGCGADSPMDQLLANFAGTVDEDAPEEFTTTKTGLKYRILRKGTGEHPRINDKVEVNYAGWFDNGRVFETSYDTTDTQTFPMNKTIAGMAEGLNLTAEGGMVELEIPSRLGYGSKGSGKLIPPNATLHFLIELVRVIPAPKPVEPGLPDPDAPEEFTKTPSGLKYRILRQGDGKKPTLSDKVQVHYRAWLDDGTVFDSSYARGEPTAFVLSLLVAGWGEGLQFVGVGGMIELEVPSNLGYGPQGSPPVIPPNATLHFLVELLGTEPLQP